MTGELLRPIKWECSILIVEHGLDFIRSFCDVITRPRAGQGARPPPLELP
ncbi:MAG: hypothetical protein M3P93_10860 [Actinomycetota bacterium]|nr:hypothetical protein [Actinomycetota bacterium]